MIARVVLGGIALYRRWISPLMRRHCRYEPTCSAYAQEAIQVHGILRGSGMALRRISRCHPWALGGVDRVPAGRRT